MNAYLQATIDTHILPPVYPVSTPPETGQTYEISPGIHWIRLHLPFKPDHINIWLIEEEDGWTLIDTGFNSDENRAIWQDLFTGLMKNKPIKQLILTHHHIDHMDLAGWLCNHFNAPLLSSIPEIRLFKRMSSKLEADEKTSIEEFFTPHNATEACDLFLNFRSMSSNNPIPATILPITSGQELTLGGKRWSVLLCSGHTASQVLLFCKELNLLITGDHILPTISSNIGLWPYTETASPMNEYLDSLDLINQQFENPLILPSHGYPFTGLTDRTNELAIEHHQQLKKIVSCCVIPKTLNEVLPELFRFPLIGFGLALAVAETLACIEYLVTGKQLTRQLNQEGLQQFVAVK